MMTMRLQVILEHIPITQDQIQNYIVYTQVNKVARPASSMTTFRFLVEFVQRPPRRWTCSRLLVLLIFFQSVLIGAY